MDYKIDIDKEFPAKEVVYDEDFEYYDSDDCEDEYDMFINEVNTFLDNNFYNVILLSEQIKNNFFYNPNFLSKLDSNRLMNIFVDYLFYDGVTIIVHQTELYKFIDQYVNEIDISYNMINTFLSPYKCVMDYDIWIKICKKFSS